MEEFDSGWVDYTLSQICHENYELSKELTRGKKFGSYNIKFPHPRWKDHLNCKFCETTKQFLTYKPPAHPLAAEPDTAYAFTLTMPPDYETKKPIDEIARLIMQHGLTNKPYEKPHKWAYVMEHTEKGTPHIHGVYQTPSGRRISSKYFKRYWSLWDEKKPMGHGHQGGYHNKARHLESYEAYMQKEGVVHNSSE